MDGNHSIDDTYRKARDWVRCRQRRRVASSQVEHRSVAGAFEASTFYKPFRQRCVSMRALILDGEV